MARSCRWASVLTAFCCLIGLLAAGAGSWVLCGLAQSGEQIWSEPVNLSQSGAASEPAVIAGPDGTLQVFWWDQFDGLTRARWDGEEWRTAASPISVYQEVREEMEVVPIEEMPFLTGDTEGRVHALWLGAPAEETGFRPLMHSRLAAGGASWAVGSVVAPAALVWYLEADPDGILHLVYVRPQESDLSPAGVYYRRSTDGGGTWSAPQVLYSSMYCRLLSAEEAYVWAAADGEGRVYVTWDDPRQEISFYAISADGGLTWEGPQPVGDLEEGSRRASVVLGEEGEALLLWRAIRVAGGCAFYQQPTGGGAAPRRVLEDLAQCPEGAEFLRPGGGQVVLVIEGASGGLTLVAWDESTREWSEPKWLGFGFEDPELGRQVYLESLRVVLTGEYLAVVGQGQGGDVWFLQSRVSVWEWAFAPLPSWSEPVALSQSKGWSGLPAVATDGKEQLHLLWSEAPAAGQPGRRFYYIGYNGTRWTQPVEVLSTQKGKAEQPALTVVGDRLHAVWSGGQNGKILYSRVYVRDAYAPGGWSEPQALPASGDVGNAPAMVADPLGTLHVVYAVPLNEGRGIYYTHSADGGGTWSEAQVVLDAAAAGWAMVDHPSLAVDDRGVLHVVWVRAPLPGSGWPEVVYYARSADGAAFGSGVEGAWSEPVQVAEGTYDWPQVAVALNGSVHLVWGEVDGSRSWFHEWSVDGGANWTAPERIGRFAGVTGPAALVEDGVGGLHLIGVGEDEVGEPALLYITWAEGRWEGWEAFRLPADVAGEPGAVGVLRPALGRLDVAFRGVVAGAEGEARGDVFYASRSLPAVEATLTPLAPPRPTTTPTPDPTPLPTPTPRPAVAPEAPLPGPPALSLGPITLPYLALGGLFVAALLVVVVGVLALRPRWAGRRPGVKKRMGGWT